MKSKNFIIPACLVTTNRELIKRLEFAQTVGNSLHIDIIETSFVDGKSLSVTKWPQIEIEYCEAHLMVTDPIPYLSKIKSKGVTRAIIHVESQFDLEELVTEARVNDILLGFAVSPETDLTILRRFLAVSTYIQVMGVHPGKTSQSQLPHTALAVTYLNKLPYRLTISVDGGVNIDNVLALKQAGADFVVVSSALYGQGDWSNNYQTLQDQLKASSQWPLKN